MSTLLNPVDAAWFYVEQDHAPAHFGPLMILTPPAHAPASYVTDLVEQWRQCRTFAPPFNLQLVRRPLPAWKSLTDEEIDLNYHLRHVALPVPGGERELGILISELHSHPLNLQRPLWEAYVIEGLAQGRFAIFLKFHHGQLDGVGAARQIAGMLSVDPQTADLGPPWLPGSSERAPSSPAAAAGAPDSTSLPGLRQAAAVLRTARATASAAQRLAMMTLSARLDSASPLVGPYQAPHTILNNRISGYRRFATQHYELAKFKSIAHTAGVTVNDVFLSITGDALRRYLSELDALPEQTIIGQIPVNIRPQDDAGNVGNALTFMYARLHTDIADPLERLTAVSASVKAGKSLQESLPADQVGPFTMLLLGPHITEMILRLGGYLATSHNLIISNVPGPRDRMYLNGCRVEQIYGPSVLFHGQALNITMSSYAGGVDISYTACRESVPHVQKLAVYTGEALDALETILKTQQRGV
ncbi:wax ester/triacylglycerol synthase family O-acyltransferase [Mycobacterium sp.]|uniref:WS/DGAT/MGAT family O-acyltransferase n=1 Tax=Mycobacterium sp. TaxID=1785 RepID=UPI0025EA458C|nr:wax ester/triacylglycerol synthase family O-acyltransferase [Mycobacterium sp.]